jgi:head-tail adaptor
MAIIGTPTAIGQRPHQVVFEQPGDPVADGKGGYTEGAATPIATLFVRIAPASAGDMERVAPGTVLSHASYVVSAPYHAGLTTRARMRYHGRAFSVMGVTNLEERNVELRLVCEEVVT